MSLFRGPDIEFPPGDRREARRETGATGPFIWRTGMVPGANPPRWRLRMKVKSLMTAAAALLVTGTVVYAGTASTEFDTAATMMTNWLEGSLGLSLALAFFAVGMFMGIARQNLMAMAVAMGCAFAVILGPGILAGIVTGSAAPIELAGTIDATPEALPAVLVN